MLAVNSACLCLGSTSASSDALLPFRCLVSRHMFKSRHIAFHQLHKKRNSSAAPAIAVMKAFTYRLQAKTSKPLLVNIQTSGAFLLVLLGYKCRACALWLRLFT